MSYPFSFAMRASKLGLVLTTPTISISSCAATASATRFPIVPKPLIATFANMFFPASNYSVFYYSFLFCQIDIPDPATNGLTLTKQALEYDIVFFLCDSHHIFHDRFSIKDYF